MDNFSFAQCACVLFARSPSLEEVERALERWGTSGRPRQGEGEDGWALCGPGFTIDLRSGAFAIVDVVDRPWPDDLATAEKNPAIGSAWRVGAFGSSATPGALARAADQPWLWEGAEVAARHGGFVRLRTGHAVQEGKELSRHDAAYELASLTDLARDLLRLPGALAFFVPGGEALRSREQVETALSRKVGSGPPPIELWMNVRAIELPKEGDVRWLLLDVIGLNQLRLPDAEAIFADGQEDPEAVEALLRNAARHLVSGGGIAPGSTADDGRGRRWRASAARGLVSPFRPVVRWLPEESARPAEAMLAKLSTTGTG